MRTSLLIFLYVSLLSSPFCPIRAETPDPDYVLSVTFDIAASRVIGQAAFRTRTVEELVFFTGSLTVSGVTVNGRNTTFETRGQSTRIFPQAPGIVMISYEGVFKDGSETGGTALQDRINSRGLSLNGTWYPKIGKLLRYRLKALLPHGYEAVSSADRTEKAATGNLTEFTFFFNQPLEDLSFIAGNRYTVVTDRVNAVDLYAYFFPENQELAKAYLQQARIFIELYEKLLGKYPHGRFSLVENFMPAGHSAPTFTVVDKKTVTRPLAHKIAVAREILGQWFGNRVYVDTERGNWAEGLITYLADHFVEQQDSRGPEFRKQLLAHYSAYVNKENKLTLRQFRQGTDPASRAIGRGKGAFFFHMLMQSMTEEVFFGALREFIAANEYQRANWDDLRMIVEKNAGKDYASFFEQWLDKKGLPELIAENGAVQLTSRGFETGFALAQKGAIYSLDLRAEVQLMRGGIREEYLRTDAAKKNISLVTEEEPSGIVIDGNYDVARILSADETPPTIAAMLGERSLVVISAVSNEEAYKPVLDSLKSHGAREIAAAGFTDADIRESSLTILGHDNPVITRLFGMSETGQPGFSIAVRKNPWNPHKVVAIISSSSAAQSEEAWRRIADYDKYSSVSFGEDKNVAVKITDSQRGLAMTLRKPTAAVNPSSVKTLEDAIQGALDKKIVYVGEQHDKYSHHMVQLQVIKAFYEKNQKVAIGMEMFQRPFQKVLDDYLDGGIDERTFLKKSEYFKRWGFDYNLYKPILDFARARKLPVVALNLDREIIDSIAKGGLDSLDSDRKEQIPQQLDFSDDEYRQRLNEVFLRHGNSAEKNFDFFYQAQVLWDETMSLSIDEFLKNNPEYRMVVIAGNGHILFGSGIPKRTYRRNSLPFYIIANDAEVEHKIADYVVTPEPIDAAGAPKIMASLSVENSRVTVMDLPRDSVSKIAGMQVGDVILSLDGSQVTSVEDIKLLLFFKQKGETLKVRVLRKGLLFAAKETEIAVKL